MMRFGALTLVLQYGGYGGGAMGLSLTPTSNYQWMWELSCKSGLMRHVNVCRNLKKREEAPR